MAVENEVVAQVLEELYQRTQGEIQQEGDEGAALALALARVEFAAGIAKGLVSNGTLTTSHFENAKTQAIADGISSFVNLIVDGVTMVAPTEETTE